MPRLMRDDPTRQNPLALLTTAKIAACTDATYPVKDYIRVSGDATLRIEPDCVFSVGERNPTSIFVTNETIINASHIDNSLPFMMGRDYYIYICDNSTDDEVFRISLNTTFPQGFNASNSRKIGGFHYGRCRRVNNRLEPINGVSAVRGAGWEGSVFEGIVPRSVWTLAHRPKCTPEGMVFLGDGTWVDIYLSSTNGAGGLQSAINMLPLTGTEGHNWFAFNEMALVSDKRFLTYAEWCKAAFGSPQGNDGNNINAHSQTTNTARALTGSVANAVSSLGCVDCVGNVWEWLDEFMTLYSATGANAMASNSWHDVLGAGNGRAHMNAASQLIALSAGGAWSSGVSAGPRAVTCTNVPWAVSTTRGVRCASDSL